LWYDRDQAEQEKKLCNRTKRLLRFFCKYLGFDKRTEVLILNETEAKDADFYLQQSKPYKQYNKKLQRKLGIFANRCFSGKESSQQQILQVFLNESDEEDVFDFVVNRNCELGLQILHPRSWIRGDDVDKNNDEGDEIVKIYIRKLREKLKSVN